MSIDERRTRKQNHIMDILRDHKQPFADIQNNIEKQLTTSNLRKRFIL
jgi:hypothetical protein